MIGFQLTEADRMAKQLAHDFATKEIRPAAAAFDDREEFPWEIVRAGARLGLAGQAWGGPNVETSAFTSLVIAEELAWGCAGIAIAMLANGLAATAINVIGTDQQRQRFLPMCTALDGEAHVGALGITEAE